VTAFPQLLRECREAAGLSQNALARRVDINPGTINRLEAGEREPTGRDQVLALATGIGLDREQTDRLVAAAGYAPTAYDAVGLADPTLIRIAEFLGAPNRPPAERQAVLRLLALVMAGPVDATIQTALDILADPSIPAEERHDFRLQIALAARRWRQVPLP